MSIAIGVDIGQQADPTAIVAVETYRPEPMTLRDSPAKRHRIRWVERVPLGTDYQKVVDRIATVGEAARHLASR